MDTKVHRCPSCGDLEGVSVVRSWLYGPASDGGAKDVAVCRSCDFTQEKESR